MQTWLNPIELEGNLVKLVPLATFHTSALLEAASDGNLWELWYTSVPSVKTVESYVQTVLNEQKAGLSLPFVVVEKATEKVIGTTRYLNADSQNRRVEIGATWYAKRTQRTGINTECKQLLLTHAFETLNTIAVEFRTHFHNHPSRNAILRLGAKQEGILRNHKIDHNGLLRDTVVFSILDTEWPAVKKSLDFKMKKSYS
ncbi:GNAT family N-acetyltransferase [Flagellimonas sp. S3867]|uniref:GNAT family N-acetyltransferase n=1 Tax=Flagellimonas sp. S3867 TaxID=2768063 RepID=UPI001CC24F1B|nr:GNAT family protein [Flagellimonas sp. S3867]